MLTKPKNKDSKFPVNLPIPFDDAPVQVTDAYKPTTSGVFFDYVNELAEFDAKTIPEVINRHFLPLLGDDAEDAQEAFESVKIGVGILYKTTAGKILSHMFRVIDISLKLQTAVLPVIVKGSYTGCLMLGAGYMLEVNKRAVVIATRPQLDALLRKVDPHGNTLHKIMSRLNFRNDEERSAGYQGCDRMYKLKALFDSLGLKGGNETRTEIEAMLPHIDFQETPHAITPENLALVFQTMSDTSISLSTLPYIHYSQLFSMNRRHIVWSSFGETAPSFRVATGKTMNISGKMAVTYRTKGGEQKTRDVTKLGLQVVDLAQALIHLDQVFETKEIMNPFGNAQVRVSDSSLYKTFEKESATKIITALRGALGVKTVTDPGVGKKRRNDDEEGSSTGKKRKIMDELF